MAELGFDPAVAEDGGRGTMAFTRCPFRELAEAFPDVVCPLHRGLVEGVADATAGGRVRRFGTARRPRPLPGRPGAGVSRPGRRSCR